MKRSTTFAATVALMASAANTAMAYVPDSVKMAAFDIGKFEKLIGSWTDGPVIGNSLLQHPGATIRLGTVHVTFADGTVGVAIVSPEFVGTPAYDAFFDGQITDANPLGFSNDELKTLMVKFAAMVEAGNVSEPIPFMPPWIVHARDGVRQMFRDLESLGSVGQRALHHLRQRHARNAFV